MRLVQMSVRNFRALQQMDIKLYPMTVVIGENDVGKTSCMLAIQTLFEKTKLDEKSDFFKCDASKSVTIEARFQRSPSETIHAVERPPEQRDLRIRCGYKLGETRSVQLYKPVPKGPALQAIDKQTVGDLRTTLQKLGKITTKDKPAKPEAQSLLRKHVASLPAEEFEDAWSDVKETELKRLLPDFVFVPVSRDLESSLRMTETSLLGRLFRPLFRQALGEGDLEKNLGQLRSRLEESAEERVAALQALLREQLNNQTVALTHSVDLDPIKGLAFDFGMDDERVQGIPIEKRGAGVHNNLTLAMFRLLAESGTKDFILAIEEPENSLHPRGQRSRLRCAELFVLTGVMCCFRKRLPANPAVSPEVFATENDLRGFFDQLWG